MPRFDLTVDVCVAVPFSCEADTLGEAVEAARAGWDLHAAEAAAGNVLGVFFNTEQPDGSVVLVDVGRLTPEGAWK